MKWALILGGKISENIFLKKGNVFFLVEFSKIF
jgi:hypothetical protein